jgi:hypothetical protein
VYALNILARSPSKKHVILFIISFKTILETWSKKFYTLIKINSILRYISFFIFYFDKSKRNFMTYISLLS